MTIFYDPKTKKTKFWVTAIFILIPVIIFFIVFLIGKAAMQKEPKSESLAEQDIAVN